MNRYLSRRTFLSQSALAAASLATMPAFAAQKKRKIHLGHTGITWRNAEVDQAIESVSSSGFYGFETFGEVLARAEEHGGLRTVLKKNNIPLISGYCTINLTDPEKKKDELDKAVRWCGLIKKNGGRVFVVGPNQVPRQTYDFAANKSNIISTLNELSKTVTDQGLTPVLHQHTGTCIESRDETYAVLDAVDTNHLKFGPDVGQLTKGGQDALKVVKDFLPLVQHMHLKDFNGKSDQLLGYCPLGQGQVDVAGILDVMEGRKISGMVMVELDNDFKGSPPVPPATLVKESRDYLRSIGVRFRA
ncbi:sugar phosphate isomerase/epimerase [Edaphobacter sp. 12200R-103]|uniref:sugar phosphate isomerase/epimerase family protein n=1 Tax=Edaphobacter sp. 12200R-103 TaxID=2703788 RepID=UPI00138B895E|nr:sugar phosphate isomerase/epimerase [Edaphobacter sp. 12200R-103]QHS52257.1 TIM barrel protein [Edaphobacter sp. 12200R-103]